MADNINDLLALLNTSDVALRYNSVVESDISQNGGTVCYSYNNIIIASEISEELYNQLKINPYIDYIEDLPLKKYGEIDSNLIGQLDIDTISSYSSGTDSISNGSIILNTGITYTGLTTGIDGLSGRTKKTVLQNLQNNVASGVVSSGIAPIITNDVLSISAFTNSWFNYQLYANGTAPLFFEVIKPTNYDGTLSIQNDSILSGMTNYGGIYNIIINVRNNYGSYTKNLTLNILDPIKITNTNLQVYGKVGSQFNYAIESTGNPPKIFNVTGLPPELTLTNNMISGIFISESTSILNITVSGTTSSDTKEVIVTSGSAPIITSSGVASCIQYSGFTYTITSIPSGITYNIIGILPERLQFSIDTISGVPIYDGSYDLKIKATNPFGTTLKNLTIAVYSI